MPSLALIPMFLTAARAEHPGWAPLGRSELGPSAERRTEVWRDARVVEGPLLGFAAAVGHEERILVAAALAQPDASVALTVRARVGDRWEDLPPVALAPRDGPEEQTIRLSMTTDPADRPIIAWLRAGGSLTGLARWRDETWEITEVPTPSADVQELAVVWLAGTTRLYLFERDTYDGHWTVYDAGDAALGAWERTITEGEALETTPSVEGRRQVAITGPWGRVAWSSAPLPANPSLDHHLVDAPSGWDWVQLPEDWLIASASGSPRGPAYAVEAWPAEMGTHYGCEFNRLRVCPRAPVGWVPLGDAPLRVGRSCSLDATVALLPTAQPTIVTSLAGSFYSAGDDLSVLRWTGERWWGLDGEPSPGTELGDPELGVGELRFEPDGRLVWLEYPDGALRLAGARWSGLAWVHDPPMDVTGSFGVRSGDTLLGVNVGGTWDRVWRPDRLISTLVQRREGVLHPIPLPELTGADATTCGVASGRPCVPAAMVELSDGSVLIALHPDSGRSPDGLEVELHDGWQLWRYAEGAWSREPTPPVPGNAWDELQLFGGQEPVLWVGGALWIRGEAGWTAIPAYRDLGAPDDLLSLGGGHILAAWTVPQQNDALRVRVAAWTGSRWDERDARLPDSASQPYLALSPKGVPYIATVTEDGEVQLRALKRGRWRGLAGSDAAAGVSNSPAHSSDPAVGFVDGKVCVAWAEEADREPVVSVRCHAE